MVDDRLGTLPEAITARADITADRLTALSDDINNSISQSMSNLETSATKIEETIGSSISMASLKISSDIEQTTSRMDIAVRTALEQVKDAARHIEDLVEVKAVETADTLSAKLDEMNQVVATQSDNFANIISTKSEELEGSLKGHSNILLEALGESSREAEELMSQSSNRILTDVNDALTKLNNSNLLLQRVLETSSSNLSKLETSVANQTSSYSSTVKEAVLQTEQAGNMVSEHVGALQTTMSSITNEFSSILANIKSETADMNIASKNLEEAGNSSVGSLSSRQEAMSTLVNSFISRSNEVDENMRSFAQSITDTITETEQRLELANKAMESSIISSGDKVSDQLSEFSLAFNQTEENTSEQLKNTKQALIDEMNQALQEASNRFNETANSMRITAHQVGSELELTRNELQRGVMDLPEETRASAAAMRRVVAEQIEALNELNSIVKTQSQPSTSPIQRRVQPEPEVVAPTKQSPQLDNFHSDNQANSNLAELLKISNTKVNPQSVEQPVQKESNSWLRDVLRNASANQEAQQPTINLAKLIDEVNKSMDEKALNDAWQNYKSGETNVFSRRIYTLVGQGTFDEVRKKLQHDKNFAQHANAYIKEFEQFLGKVAADPKAKRSLIDYLISDRGKVYTMLAHASGQLS